MAAPSGQLKAARYFAPLAVIIVVLYALVFFTGDKKPHPKLGLDLQGGTSMTLAAKVPGGGTPSRDSMDQAKEIITSRVDASGVAEPDVVIDGNSRIVVNVAGKSAGDELRKLVAPAVLRFRKVLSSTADTSAATDSSASPSGSASASPSASGSASPKPSGSASASAPASGSASAPASGSASAPASGSASAPASGSASASDSPAPVAADVAKLRDQVAGKLGMAYTLAQSLPDPDPQQPMDAQTTAMLEPFGKLTPEEVAALPADMQYKVPQVSCKLLDQRPPATVIDQKQKVVACGAGSAGGQQKYLLDVSKVTGEDVSNAGYVNDTSQGGWKVDLSFKSGGQDKWTALTKEAYDNGAKHEVAVVLDTRVVSAPAIQEVISGNAQITGSFSQDDVRTLSRQLKYGSLPLSFEIQSVDDVTATLGVQYLKYGLIAGAVGLVLVIAYCMVYYRALGLVVIASLVVSAAVVFGSLVVLGRQLGYTLSLAGIAGFIVAIGITADSFVVFFERIKDEVKESRTVRSAVPRAWIRARRTILSADVVSLLAAAVLYILAIGPVKGFAFTLGLSTIIDLLVVFLFTHPLVSVLSRANAFTAPRVSGLGNLRSDKAVAAAQSASRFGAVRTKES